MKTRTRTGFARIAFSLLWLGATTVSAHDPAEHRPAAPPVPLDEDCAALAMDHRHDAQDPLMQALMQRCGHHDHGTAHGHHGHEGGKATSDPHVDHAEPGAPR